MSIGKGPTQMLAGLDTGFFFALQEEHPVALRIWFSLGGLSQSLMCRRPADVLLPIPVRGGTG